MKIYYIAIIFQVFINLIGILRVLGVWDTVHFTLFLSKIIDVLFIIGTLCLFVNKIRIPYVIIPINISIIIAFMTGAINHNFNMSFASDIFTYYFFIFKVVIFYSLFKDKENIGTFKKFIKRFSLVSLLVMGFTLIVLEIFLLIGYSFYFGAGGYITYAYILSVAGGKYFFSYLILALAFLSGRRFVVIGLLVIFLLGFKRFLRRKKHYALILYLLLVAFLGNAFLPKIMTTIPMVGFNKVINTFTRPELYEGGINTFFYRVDNARYNEVLGIVQSLNFNDWLFGKGFGFRYFYANNQAMRDLEITHSNSHFSPIGIMSKFGIVGFVIWYLFFFNLIYKAYLHGKTDDLNFCNFLFLSSILVQSSFAYIIFINPIVPIIAGQILSAGREN